MIQEILHITIAMLAVINSFICAGMLLQIPNTNKEEQYRNATQSMIIVLVILLISAIGGVYILKAFGISMSVFQLLGGIVLTYIGFNMYSNKSNNKSSSDLNQLIMFAASPGTIAMAITFSSQSKDGLIPLNEIIGITIAVSITWIVMLIAVKSNSKVEHKKQSYSAQFMGLIVAGMGLQFALEGIKNFFF